jgi:ankyrin repeat protein
VPGCTVRFGDVAYQLEVRTKEDDDLDGLLFKAAHENDMESIYDWLNGGGDDVDPVDFKGQTPLFIAVSKGLKDIVEFLLCHGADPTLTADGSSPLSVAVRSGDTGMITCLLCAYSRRGAPRGEKAPSAGTMRLSADGTSPLIVAVRYASCNIEFFIEQGADVDQRDGQGWTPLVAAVHAGKMDAVISLLNANANANKPNAGSDPETGRKTPLGAAVKSEDLSFVRFLLQHGAFPQTPEEEDFVLDDKVRCDIRRRADIRRRCAKSR